MRHNTRMNLQQSMCNASLKKKCKKLQMSWVSQAVSSFSVPTHVSSSMAWCTTNPPIEKLRDVH